MCLQNNNVKLIKKGFVIKTIGKFGVANLRKSSAPVQRSTILFYFLLIPLALLVSRCANPVSPTGGPKDSSPPKVIACDPPNFSTKFKENSFSVDFNEFINLKNPATEIFISPPLKSPLDPRIRGKSVVVKFEDSLAANTTYSISFGNAINDLTEGNILKGFSYVFSTGDFVDSLSLQGNLNAAFDLKPQKDVFIELYINNNDTIPFDSLPLRVAPYYIAKSDEQGNFTFHNLRNEPYKLFALADQNGDLIFNQPSEKIAFYDSLAKPYYISIPKPDTSLKDSTQIDPAKSLLLKVMNADSLRKSDSIHKADSIKQNFLLYPVYPLFLFEEADSVQRLLKATFPKKGMALFVFRHPVKNLTIVPMNFDSVTPWFLEEYSTQKDSVRLWITRPDVDSLIAKVIIANKTIDTVRLEVLKKDNQKKQSDKEKQERLTLSIASAGSGFNQYKNKLVATFSYPLIRWDFKKVLLIAGKDTTNPDIKFADSLKRRISIFARWEEDKGYKIIIPDSVFFGIHEITHDTLKIDFRTKGEKDFGNLIVAMNMEKRPGQYIVQLLNEKESVVYEEQIITGSGTISFNFMPPGKYKLKAINDRNRNKRWDTGNYKLNLQPEEVIYMPKIVEIRANWDVEETWD
jgi:hypothetical protein